MNKMLLIAAANTLSKFEVADSASPLSVCLRSSPSSLASATLPVLASADTSIWSSRQNDSALAAQVRSRLLDHKGSNTTVDIVPSADANARADLIRQIHAESIDGLLSIDAQPGALPTATYTSRSAGDFQTNGRLRNAVNDGIVANHGSRRHGA